MKKFLCYDTNDAASGKIPVNNQGVLIGGLGAVVTYKGEITEDQSRIKFKATPDEIKMHYKKGDLIKIDYLDPGSEPNTVYFVSATGDFSSALFGHAGGSLNWPFSYTDGWYTAVNSMF